MQASWFFATTPNPQRPHAGPARERRAAPHTRTWWQRAADRLVAWGERSRRRANPSLMQL
jgi:hypothetical protein